MDSNNYTSKSLIITRLELHNSRNHFTSNYLFHDKKKITKIVSKVLTFHRCMSIISRDLLET